MKLLKKIQPLASITGLLCSFRTLLYSTLLLASLVACQQPDAQTVRHAPDKQPHGVSDACWEISGLILEWSTHPSRHAAQIEQESSCDPKVESWDHGKGLSQFTGERNTQWIARTYCAELGMAKPFNPEWSIRCGDLYMLSFRNDGLTECQGWRFDESAYNGGQGWLNKEKRLAEESGQDPRNYNKVRKFCDDTRRSTRACGWNREYTGHIDRRQPKYLDYGGNICADG